MSDVSSAAIRISAALLAVFCLSAQNKPAPPAEAHPIESQGLPPRDPGDYQAQAKAGDITIAADFAGHSVPTGDLTLTTEDFVVVDVALFGATGAHIQISPSDFSLHVNKKKNPLPSQSYVVVFSSLRDPDWVNPEEEKDKESKTSINGGGGGGAGANDSSNLPKIVHIPIELQRNWQQHAQKAAFPSGDRPLPQAGLLYFQYRGKTKGINSLELIYSGPAGEATLRLQP